MRRRKRKEEQARIKDELSRPISMPDLGEKSDYEKIREKTIRDRHHSMKESGMFSDSDKMDKMLTSKLYD